MENNKYYSINQINNGIDKLFGMDILEFLKILHGRIFYGKAKNDSRIRPMVFVEFDQYGSNTTIILMVFLTFEGFRISYPIEEFNKEFALSEDRLCMENDK